MLLYYLEAAGLWSSRNLRRESFAKIGPRVVREILDRVAVVAAQKHFRARCIGVAGNVEDALPHPATEPQHLPRHAVVGAGVDDRLVAAMRGDKVQHAVPAFAAVEAE